MKKNLSILLIPLLCTAVSGCFSFAYAQSGKSGGGKKALWPGKFMQARMDESKEKPALPVVLQGGIEHKETMAPLSKELRAGTVYNTANLSALASNNMWYQLPPWLAGYWHCEKDEIVFEHNYKTGKSSKKKYTVPEKFNEQWGFLKDRQGHVWDYVSTPYTTVMDAGDHIFVQSVIGKEPLKVSDEEVLVRFTTFCQNVDKKSHVVMEAYQMEALQTYRKLSEKAVSCQSSTKQFDEFGNPATLVNRNSVHTLLEPFADIYTFDNKDLRKLFAQYLRRHGQENLIPRFENF